MNLDAARSVADAVLYEGYVLYPYRASAPKNRSRWQFGVLVPPSYTEVDPTESSAVQTECLLEYTDRTVLRVLVRFLQVQQRLVQTRDTIAGWVDVESLAVDGASVARWDEAVEREADLRVDVARLLDGGYLESLHADGGDETQTLGDGHGEPVGRLVRRRHVLDGIVTVTAEPLPGPWQCARLRVRVENHTRLDPPPQRRADALPAALVAVHAILGAEHGAFVSMLDPPEWAKVHVDACVNLGAWPALVGDGRDLVLSSPIILYDQPEVATESPGPLYDGTEIDEILTLRTLALTDEEKREARATDPRAAELIDRVDDLDAATVERMHGVIRSLRPMGSDAPEQDDTAARPAAGRDEAEPDSVTVGDTRISHGSGVRLRPGARRADAQDMFLSGRLATVEAVLRDLDDQPYLAVTLADDPGADLRRDHGRFLYFSPDEVEPA